MPANMSLPFSTLDCVDRLSVTINYSVMATIIHWRKPVFLNFQRRGQTFKDNFPCQRRPCPSYLIIAFCPYPRVLPMIVTSFAQGMLFFWLPYSVSSSGQNSFCPGGGVSEIICCRWCTYSNASVPRVSDILGLTI